MRYNNWLKEKRSDNDVELFSLKGQRIKIAFTDAFIRVGFQFSIFHYICVIVPKKRGHVRTTKPWPELTAFSIKEYQMDEQILLL